MRYLFLLLTCSLFFQCEDPKPEPQLTLNPNDHIVLVGGNLCSRMMEFGHFETELQLRYPEHKLYIRNMCDAGNTPGFQAHSARNTPYAFQGAEAFYEGNELSRDSDPQGDFPSPDQWLERAEADVILGFFGWSESFDGPDRLETFKEELAAWIEWNSFSEYNGESEPRIALISPTYFQDVTERLDVPNGEVENKNLELYTEAIREVAAEAGVPFIDVFDVTKEWFTGNTDLTSDGVQLTDKGYRKLAPYLADALFGGEAKEALREDIHALVMDKNFYWKNDYKIPNGVHVYGRRHTPFGPDNYPMELRKIQEMTAIRDSAIWSKLAGVDIDIAAADANTYNLPPVETNYTLTEDDGSIKYLYGEEAMASFTVPEGFKVELFASEEMFPELANPAQMSFDNKGRLWVSCMPTYPHYKPGDAKPDDKLVIIEDTDNDGKADKVTEFASDLHVPVGFELAPEGVYVSQGSDLVLLKDTDGDDKYDEREIIFSGFDDHDTHHTVSAWTTDPSGAIVMGEGIFLHTNVETPYGPVRATNGGHYRFQPQKRHLERLTQIAIPNPWGTVYDDYGQPFFLHTSDPAVRWLMPSTMKNHYGIQAPMSRELIPDDHRVRPTSGVEIVSSRHFPEEMQGDLIYNNTIGFLGTKQFQMEDDGTGYKLSFRQDLLRGDDTNFRPVDLEFAPDGSLYIVDWHNVLVGHMQHNARDPLRDHVHGRIYRITYPGRPLVEPAKIDGASIETLFANLMLPEARTRYRTQRELRGRDANEVVAGAKAFVAGLDKDDPEYDRYVLEALHATWGVNAPDQELVEMALNAEDYRVRAGAVQVLRYNADKINNQAELLNKAAADEHGRVRLAAVMAATWMPEDVGRMVIATANEHPVDDWMEESFKAAPNLLTGEGLEAGKGSEIVVNHLKGADLEQFAAGWDIYHEDGSCQTCHQKTGKGLNASQFPPLAGSSWVEGDPEVLARILLKGLIGPIKVNGRDYPGQVPMTPYEDILNDEQMANVMTYVRNAFGNRASVVSPEYVAGIRAKVEAEGQKGYYKAEDLKPLMSKK